MPYYVFPSGSQSHTVTLTASSSPSAIVALPGGLTIAWRQDGVVVAGKSGDTASLSLQSISFDATDSGSAIDFTINASPSANAVVLTNNAPTLSGAGFQTDAYAFIDGLPTVRWTFSDLDSDPQYGYKLRLGTIPGGNDIYDTGFVVSTAKSVTFPGPAIAAGTKVFYSLSVTDGQKVVPTDPDSTSNRVFASTFGAATVNTPPTVAGVQANGVYGGGTVSSLTPTITWVYDDVDAQPQQSFRVIVAKDAGLTDRLYDSGTVSSNVASVVYGTVFSSGLANKPIIPHQLLYVGVQVSDTFSTTSFSIETFVVSNPPTIIVVTVGDGVTNEVNPLNVISQFPTFTWDYQDLDMDGLSAYDIRIADNSGDMDGPLGSDGFIGNVWSPGVVVTPESYQTTFDQDGKAFGSCHMPHAILVGVTYYFQVQVYAGTEKSEWWTGFFRLNRPPTATNLAIIPASPFKSDDLEATFTFNDDPGDVQSPLTQIRWYQNGVLVPSLNDQNLVPSSMTRGGDSWYFTVRPSEGKAYGPLETSASVVVVDRPPQAVGLGISPAQPRTADDLKAIFAVSDPDGDDVTVSIRWYQNGAEVPALKNNATVPASLTTVGDLWYFTITPNDGDMDGAIAQSPSVIIRNTAPRVTALTVDGRILPFDVASANPVIGWRYADDDGQAEKAFQVALGTKPLRTQGVGTGAPSSAPRGLSLDGIVSTAGGNGVVVSGKEVFDSGVIQGSLTSLQYATDDFVPTFTLGAADALAFNGAQLSADLRTMKIAPGGVSGSVTFQFPGQQATYEVSITYALEAAKRSSYKLLIDGVVVDQFNSVNGTGTDSHKFKSAQVMAGSSVTLIMAQVDLGAAGAFQSLLFTPLEQSTITADQMTLSGYAPVGDGSIKLVGLAGTATTNFALPSGTYDVELDYVTETTGNPSMSLTIRNSVVLSFAFESGVKNRSRFVQGVTINAGDVVKISGARNGGAAARVRQLVFRPSQTVATGAKLGDGLTYFASVRVFDGIDWSDWATTRFVRTGSAWGSSVSNAKGWTIECRFSVAPQS